MTKREREELDTLDAIARGIEPAARMALGLAAAANQTDAADSAVAISIALSLKRIADGLDLVGRMMKAGR